jgi:hypothetical protein
MVLTNFFDHLFLILNDINFIAIFKYYYNTKI